MSWRAIAILGVMLVAGGRTDDAVTKELKKMQGTWKVSRMDVAGVKMPLAAFAQVTVVIDGDKMSFRDKGKVYDEIEFAVAPSKTPREIDLHYVAGIKKGIIEKGIYEVDSDTLKVCQSLTAKKRPSEFTSPKGASQQVMILVRQR